MPKQRWSSPTTQANMLSPVTLSLALGACHLQNTGFQRKATAVGFAYDAIICNILLLIIVISLFLPSPASDGKIVLILYRLPTKEPKDYETYPQAVVALSRRLRNRSEFILQRGTWSCFNCCPPKMTKY